MSTCFAYKNGSPIKFFECRVCHDVITGCIPHHMEYCSCGNFIDQEDEYSRASGAWNDVTNELTDEEKRKIFTKTVFNADKIDKDYIKYRLKHPYYLDTMFDINYYKELLC